VYFNLEGFGTMAGGYITWKDNVLEINMARHT
jgi:hypothetical protein